MKTIPTHEQVAVLAFEKHQRWVEESTWSPGATDPGPWHFWFAAKKELEGK